ncbi:MAG: hypothetical protein C4298_08430 [Thermus sp.]|uniref:transposase n=1 Tax=Thermus sp. TaxID=275 RepID=UPI00333077AD
MGLLARARRSKGGHYARKLETALGEVKLRIPRDRKGKVSDRRVAELVGLWFGYRYSHETIRNLTKRVQEEVEAFRHRPLPRRP